MNEDIANIRDLVQIGRNNIDNPKEKLREHAESVKKFLTRCVIAAASTTLFLIIVWIIYERKIGMTTHNIYAIIILYHMEYFILLGMSCIIINLLIYYYVNKYVKDEETGFFHVLNRQLFLTIFTVSSIFPYILIKEIVPLKYEKILCVLDILIPFSVYYLSTEIIIDTTNYKTVQCNFKDEIERNKKNVELIEKLEKRLGCQDEVDPNKIFKSVANEKNHINGEDVKIFLGIDTEKFLKLFDLNMDTIISEEEFCSVYERTFEEEKTIDGWLHSSNSCITKLKYILYVLFLPIVIFPVLKTLSPKRAEKSISFLSLDVLISFGFVFTAFFSDLFQNSFYIVFIRPFEVGDTLIMDGKLLKVVDIGLFYTDFESDSVIISICNTRIRSSNIENLRRSAHKTQIYSVVLDFEKYKKGANIIKQSIEQFLAKNPRIYDSNFSISNFAIRNDGKIEIQVGIVIKRPYSDFVSVNSAKDNFSVFLHDLKMHLDSTEI